MYIDGQRAMAWVTTVDHVEKHPDADSLDICTVGGWKVITRLGEYKEKDPAVYVSIDSWVPHDVAPFLSKGKEPREYNGVKGERLRTIKLRGHISQGLLLPITVMNSHIDELGEHLDNAEGFDCSEWLNIQKWEAPIPAQLAGEIRGNFPAEVPKTDQERIQNLSRELEKWRLSGEEWEITEKLDGSSMTCYLDFEGDFHVCSRNLDKKRNPDNTFWKVAIEQDIENKMKAMPLYGFALQGELIGEGIQKNRYGIKGHDFYIFDIYDVKSGQYLSPSVRQSVVQDLGLKSVPYLGRIEFGESITVDYILAMAERNSELNAQTEREGIVFKNHADPSISFKAISNRFLLGE